MKITNKTGGIINKTKGKWGLKNKSGIAEKNYKDLVLFVYKNMFLLNIIKDSILLIIVFT